MTFTQTNSKLHWPCLLTATVVTIAGCDRSADSTAVANVQEPPTAAAFVDQAILPNNEYLAMDPYASADLQRGERIVLQCRACHTLDRGGANMLGPNLFGIFGRATATKVGFDYSPAMREATVVWSPAALDAWLANPARFLAGNRMAFAGIREEEDRNALIAYLLSVTDEASGGDVYTED